MTIDRADVPSSAGSYLHEQRLQSPNTRNLTRETDSPAVITGLFERASMASSGNARQAFQTRCSQRSQRKKPLRDYRVGDVAKPVGSDSRRRVMTGTKEHVSSGNREGERFRVGVELRAVGGNVGCQVAAQTLTHGRLNKACTRLQRWQRRRSR